MNTWKTIPSLEDRYEINLKGEVRITKNKKPLNLNKKGYYNSSWGLGYTGGKYRWGRSINSLLNEVFPFWWIRELDDDEEVKPIKGFPGYYITNKGRVYSLHTKCGWMYGNRENSYHYSIYLYRDNKKKHKQYIHTLVGRNFLTEYKEGLFILHKDETLPYPEINFPTNLWVGDSGDNNRDRCKKGRSGGWMLGKNYQGTLQVGVPVV